MQSNRVWIAVLLVMSFLVSPAIKAQERGTSNSPAWQRADELVKKLTLDEKLQFLLSKYPSNADPGGGGYIEGVTRLHIPDHVLFSVKNDGAFAGAEVPQVYLGIDYPGEPPLRLGGWTKIRLEPGEVQQANITISPRAQSIWDTSANNWRVIPDDVVYVGSSSRDIRLKER